MGERTEARLVYEIDGRRIVHVLEGQRVTLGRAPDNDVVIQRPFVSRHHAQLTRGADGWHVTDLGSKCGTLVNGREPGGRALVHGDRIVLEDLALTFVQSEAAPSELVRGAASLPSLSLTGEAEAAPPVGTHTVFQNAVDFTGLASSSPDVARLQKLLELVAASSKAILSAGSLEQTFERVLDRVLEHLPVERAGVMLWDAEREDLTCRALRQHGMAQPSEQIQFSRTIAMRVCRDRVGVLTSDAQLDGRFGGESIVRLGIRSAMAAPIWSGESVLGLIYADSSTRARAFDRFDLDLLSALGNHLAIAIEQRRLQDSVHREEMVRRRLERYHSPAVVERIAGEQSSADAELAADEREVTLLFADVVGFTRRSEKLEPLEVAALLNRYFSEMSDVVFRHEGTIDKFIGDCLMAVFGAPLAAPDHARRAASAALDMREAMERVNASLPDAERLMFRVAIHSGKVVAGDIGSVRRRDWTVLGSTVNLASRLETEVAGPGQIVLSEATAAALGSGFDLVDLGDRSVRGFSAPVRCFELRGLASS